MTELYLHIAEVDIAISAPQNVLAVVDRMLAHVDRVWREPAASLRVSVTREGDVWRIAGLAPASRKTLSIRSALPQIAGAIVSAVLSEVTYRRNVEVWRAAAVEHEGRALVLIGDDWESCVTLIAHLHTRGWKILGGDYALVAGDTLVVTAFKKLLFANSSCIPSFPLWYRRAIEASPWYSSPQAIAFYAIDPELSRGAEPWGERAALGAVLKVDGHFADHPSLEAIDHVAFGGAIKTADLHRAGVELASLVVGDSIETCDLLERWFVAGPVPA